MKRLFSFLFTMALLASSSAWATTTVTWDMDDIGGLILSDMEPFAHEGIVLSMSMGYMYLDSPCDFDGYDGANSFTFTSSLGNFTRIEIYCSHAMIEAAGWEITSPGAVWTGDAASVSFGPYVDEATQIVFTIGPALPAASMTLAPKAIHGLVYNGETQTLITAGTASGGEMQYSLDNSNWSTDLPTATNVGVYTVHYRVVGDAEHADYIPTPNQLNISIADVGTWDGNLSTTTTHQRAKDGTVITGTLLNDTVQISIVSGATVTLNNATIKGTDDVNYMEWPGITCEGDATILFVGTDTVIGFYNGPGILVPEGSTLTLDGSGTLVATGRDDGAGIGGACDYGRGGNIIINGGNITATGGKYAAGIGTGFSFASCGDITINGGTIIAIGGEYAAGIGAGYANCSCGNITINGGTVTATGGDNATGIGTGYYFTSCGDIIINGGTVTATGGNKAAGIGTGFAHCSCGAITINGGTVAATRGSDNAEPIGAGFDSSCGTVTVASYLKDDQGTPTRTIEAFAGQGTVDDPYLIPTMQAWNTLADKVAAGNTYEGKYFRQTADISVTTMVGTGNHLDAGGGSGEVYITFNGIYDGDGHTLNANIDVVGGERYGAPFRCVSGATIKNLIVTGYVSTDGGRHPSGLIGCSPSGNILIENCHVSANVSGTDYMGGLVGHGMYANITIQGCVYSGTLTAESTNYTGGFIAWCDGSTDKTFDISDCLFAGSYSGIGNFHPIGINYHKNGHNNTRNIANTYYTALSNMSDDDNYSFANGLSYKGKQAYSITAASGVTVTPAGSATVYDVSGIALYTPGVLYNSVLYAGEEELVSLFLDHADAPAGYTFSYFSADNGALIGNDNPYTLIMADANVIIEANYTPQTPTAIDNADAEINVTKRLVNGQLLVEKNGKTYTVTGQEVK